MYIKIRITIWGGIKKEGIILERLCHIEPRINRNIILLCFMNFLKNRRF